MYLTEFIPLAPTSENYLLLASVSIPCGEAANLSTDLERFNLHEHITGGQNGVYTTSIVGDSMETDIKHGDLIIVNCNLFPNSGDIVIASINGALTVKTYQTKTNGLYLVPKNEKYKSRIITYKDDFEVFGVVVGIVRMFKKI